MRALAAPVCAQPGISAKSERLVAGDSESLTPQLGECVHGSNNGECRALPQIFHLSFHFHPIFHFLQKQMHN